MQIKWLASSFDNICIIDKGINNLLIKWSIMDKQIKSDRGSQPLNFLTCKFLSSLTKKLDNFSLMNI